MLQPLLELDKGGREAERRALLYLINLRDPVVVKESHSRLSQLRSGQGPPAPPLQLPHQPGGGTRRFAFRHLCVDVTSTVHCC
jgi:hypothetical protein